MADKTPWRVRLDEATSGWTLVRPEVGALIIGALAGSAVGGVTFWVARRFVPAMPRAT